MLQLCLHLYFGYNKDPIWQKLHMAGCIIGAKYSNATENKRMHIHYQSTYWPVQKTFSRAVNIYLLSKIHGTRKLLRLQRKVTHCNPWFRRRFTHIHQWHRQSTKSYKKNLKKTLKWNKIHNRQKITQIHKLNNGKKLIPQTNSDNEVDHWLLKFGKCSHIFFEIQESKQIHLWQAEWIQNMNLHFTTLYSNQLRL